MERYDEGALARVASDVEAPQGQTSAYRRELPARSHGPIDHDMQHYQHPALQRPGTK